jgi:hypothetical protein
MLMPVGKAGIWRMINTGCIKLEPLRAYLEKRWEKVQKTLLSAAAQTQGPPRLRRPAARRAPQFAGKQLSDRQHRVNGLVQGNRIAISAQRQVGGHKGGYSRCGIARVVEGVMRANIEQTIFNCRIRIPRFLIPVQFSFVFFVPSMRRLVKGIRMADFLISGTQ